jgi:GntR family transcriptional regulator, arabinose operon transcriptional repressor
LSTPEKSDYLYQRIYQELKNEICGGTYKIGDPFPPERALKERFTTTHITIRNALSRLVEEGYIERFSGKGTFITYTGRDARVSVPSPDLDSVYLIADRPGRSAFFVIDMLEKELSRQAIKLVVLFERNRPERTEPFYGNNILFSESLFCYLFPDVRSHPSMLQEIPMNSILITTEPSDESYPQIICDFVHGSRLLTGHLVKIGNTRIAYIGNESDNTDAQRLEGYRQALSETGLPYNEDHVVFSNGTIEGGYHACGRLLQTSLNSSIFLCDCEETALGVFQYMSDHGKVLHKDYQIACFESSEIGKSLSITSMNIKLKTIVEYIVQCISEYKNRGRLPEFKTIIKPDIIVRSPSRQV